MPIKTLLIANRGEIAIRVIRSARAAGIRTVAIHTDLDATAPHVRAADVAVPVVSYLDIAEVVAAAVAAGADAIHPGYGFLSERSAFARAVEEAGIKLVGPSSTVMDKMGRKDAAREIAVAAGVPVVPAYTLDTPATELAYPVLVKAAAGGGGKGMRIVRNADEYAGAVEAAAREAAHSFGDDTLLIEKYVESGRHIEVQVMADAHGNVLHLFERDCSTQRRHQKVLEEAPAPTISEEIRKAVTSAAVALAAEVGYENAGTVEFLLDNASGEAYFLEMNTRLQVEHPVTELAVTVQGEHPDLVAVQLRIAAGEPLGFTQDDVALAGHAIEARVYAEDSFGGFLPQAGTTSIVRWAEHARVDQALEPGQVVSTAYDPMLGKVIARGPDRESARRALVAALDETAILGLTTNVGFLRALAASDEFRDATIDTAWLDHHEVPAPDADVARIGVAWVMALLAPSNPSDPFSADGWRSAGAASPFLARLDRTVAVDRVAGTADGRRVVELSAENHVLELEVDGVRHRITANVQRGVLEAVHQGQRFVFERPDPFAEHGPAEGDGSLLSPMPGTVLAVDVTVGDQVEEGQRLGVIEAMKMELVLKAPFAGTVSQVGAATGDQVQLKQLLFSVEALDG
ncbi:acetyl/propionyl/methylcrotonyl-CoA carboxylase subunit alpha [Nocardioides marmorisolisilvae]|uniref:acetyl/propionyl/methylcrotonyl-CoA carboxylase subunit alpha n=1 Tax=Nocardioides marmorisolisilvae TaxID=1542737 RepID=UPI001FEA185C|nr:biotin carboxylase N-terminal domain-containing protein [Nocardioides marmorisolisilvae]